ncbi:MAG: sigma-70 family RNA polymerase sigma factor [Chthoniobacterales bacterium]|nr:sigma-70 family RNA polymerase sigma factor [Chthoniobacterales bacterium]MDQ3120553.1 sigma-70 family RNA polymerase sigma factor [Verrucomicrobiota bacterium]
MEATLDSTVQDTELFRLAALGDHGSLGELHRRYSGILLATAFRVLNNAKDAEEVVQEAFVQIWEKASIYDVRRGKPLTWAMTLTRNKAIDRLRRVQRRNRLQEEIEQEAQIWDRVVEHDSSDEAAARETNAIVRSAVIQLSDDQRRAIELAFFSGLTQQEIAQKLDEPLGTVKARIRRGMMKLRQIIGPEL